MPTATAEEIETVIGWCETCQEETEGVCTHYEESKSAALLYDQIEVTDAF